MVHPLISVSTEKCCLAIPDRTSSVISVRTEVPEVDIYPSRWYELNNMNHVWNRMGSDPIQSHEWVLLMFLFGGPNI